MLRRIRLGGLAALCIALSVALSGCLYALIPDTVSPSASADASDDGYTDEWVIAVYRLDSEFGSGDVLEAMLPTERRAADALVEAGLGDIDGNDIGGGEYTLYFFGDDRGAMWKVLEPILADAPLPLDSVELWPEGADAEPEVITFDQSSS